MNRRHLLTFLASMAAWPRAAFAQEGYQRFIPLLIDLPGWTGTQPAGTDEDRNGVRVISATRGYTRDEARLNVSLSLVDAGRDKPSVRIVVTRSSPSPDRPSTRRSTIDGFDQVMTTYSPSVVWIVVGLKPGATLGFGFTNVSEDEALAIAQKFDWKGMRALL